MVYSEVSGVQYQCFRCNRVADCQDKTDEIGCVSTTDPHNRTSELECSPGQWRCWDRRQCVDTDLRCDGDQDCDDGSDELQCPGPDNTCPDHHLQCSDLSCVDNR